MVPESLLAYQDWQQWSGQGSSPSLLQPESEEEFEELSKQAWTHVLMQIIKVSHCALGVGLVVYMPWGRGWLCLYVIGMGHDEI